MSTIQFNPLNFPVYVMVKPIGAGCNLRCNYCYYLEKGTFKPENHSTKMSDSTLLLFTEQYVHAQPGKQVLFTWHGGEPLLAGIDFYKKALRFQVPFKHNYHIDNVLQTNGTLLTDEWCHFFKENHFLVGLSIDGPEHCHNRYRKQVNGKGSFSEVMRGVELLQKHGVEFNILSVVTNYNVRYPLDVYHFFKTLGTRYIQFTPVVERVEATSGRLLDAGQTGILTPWSVPALEYGHFLCDIFDEWVHHDVGETFVSTFDATLAGHVGVSPGVCLFAETCGHAAALEAGGDLYACDHFVFPAYKRGNIHEKTITEMMLSEEQLQFGRDKQGNLPNTCLNCPYLHLCHGECPKNRFLNKKGEKGSLNYLCPGLTFYFKHTESCMKYMANELMNELPPANIMQALQKNIFTKD